MPTTWPKSMKNRVLGINLPSLARNRDTNQLAPDGPMTYPIRFAIWNLRGLEEENESM